MLTAKDAAKRAGVTKRTLLRWIREDQLKAEQVGTSTGPGYAVDEADLDRLIADRAGRVKSYDAQVEKPTPKSEAVAASAGHVKPPMAETSQSQADALSEALAAFLAQRQDHLDQLKAKDQQIESLRRDYQADKQAKDALIERLLNDHRAELEAKNRQIEGAQILAARAQDQAQQALPRHDDVDQLKAKDQEIERLRNELEEAKSSRPWWKLWR
jgi:excisionase family DNA binding protein